jgi:hypothetical protein
MQKTAFAVYIGSIARLGAKKQGVDQNDRVRSGNFVSKCDKRGEIVCIPNVIKFTFWNVRDILNKPMVFEQKSIVKSLGMPQGKGKPRRWRECSGFCPESRPGRRGMFGLPLGQ